MVVSLRQTQLNGQSVAEAVFLRQHCQNDVTSPLRLVNLDAS